MSVNLRGPKKHFMRQPGDVSAPAPAANPDLTKNTPHGSRFMESGIGTELPLHLLPW
jgi:hypothetical protein